MRCRGMLAAGLSVALLVTALTFTSTAASAAPGDDPAAGVKVTTVEVAQASAGTESYIVTFASTTAAQQAGRDLADAATGTIATPVLSAQLTAEQRAAFSTRDDVIAVEKDTAIKATDTRTNPPWGIDRLDQRSLPLSSSYTSTNNGSGVDVWVIDSGVDLRHSEFSKQKNPEAYDLSGSAVPKSDSAISACYLHGTHVAGTAVGRTYGVAPQARLHSLRVLDCQGEATMSRVIDALNLISAKQSKNRPAVVNMSVQGPLGTGLDAAVQALIDQGVTVVAAAGNDPGGDACKGSPSSVADAITVAATDESDRPAAFSSLGSCVDVFAPGNNIVSAMAGSRSGTVAMIGTSMAAPHVTGIAALLLSAHPNWTPAQVASRISTLAQRGVLQGDRGGSPDRLASISSEITKISPGQGSLRGRQVTISGSGLTGTATVKVGKLTAQIIKRNATSLVVQMPALKSGGITAVRVTTDLMDTSTLKYRYIAKPAVSRLDRYSGEKQGGTKVTIIGRGFDAVTAVYFGSKKATKVKRISASRLEVVAPSGSGRKSVRVVAKGGTSTKTAKTWFRYGKAPSVRKVSPGSGKSGSWLTITGKEFIKGIKVTIGGKSAKVKRVSSTKLQVRVPARSKTGETTIKVTNRYGSAKATKFRYC